MSEPQDASAPAWRKSTLRDYFESICVAVVFALFVRTFIAQAFKIPSKSMEDNLLVGDHIVVDKFGYAPHPGWAAGWLPYRPIQRCEVMVFKYPLDARRDYIKRVIGIPGDVIEVAGGHVARNGVASHEPFIALKPMDGLDPGSPLGEAFLERRRSERLAPKTVAADSFFAMGDNRFNSEDSRYWGVVPRANVKGRALLIYWSFDVPPALQPIEVNGARNAQERAQVLRYTLLHFFDKTRWRRTFRVIHGAELCADGPAAGPAAAAAWAPAGSAAGAGATVPKLLIPLTRAAWER